MKGDFPRALNNHPGVGNHEKAIIFALPFLRVGLTHGVTVAQQILVLFVKVRILMGQQAKEKPLHFAGVFL